MTAAATIVGLAAAAAGLLWISRRAYCHHCQKWFRFNPGQHRAAWTYHYEYAECEKQS